MKLSYYQDIHLLPDEEVGLREIGTSLFSLLHLGFVENREDTESCRFAISFPEYQKGAYPTLGSVFRVFAPTEEYLKRLDVDSICDRLSGYSRYSNISEVPEVTSFLKFHRVQVKSNSEKLARRLSKRKQISIEEARLAYKNFVPKELSYMPYLFLQSLSTCQKFPLFINCEIAIQPNFGFSFYGLSTNGNVPDF